MTINKRVCQECGGRLDGSKNKDSKYCSDSCRMKSYRASKGSQSVTQSVTNDAPIRNESVTEEVESVTNTEKKSALPTASDTAVNKMNAQELYDAIRRYSGGDWIDSPEKKELNKRIAKYSVAKLEAEGYWVPSLKRLLSVGSRK